MKNMIFCTASIKWYICWCWGFLSSFSWSLIHISLICSYHPCSRHWSRINVLSTTVSVWKTCWNSKHSNGLSMSHCLKHSWDLFQNFLFLISLFKLFPLQMELHWKNYPFSTYRYYYGYTTLIFFCFFP